MLLHDLLISARERIEASDKWPPKGAILKHQARLRAELVRIQLKAGKSSKNDLIRASPEVHARYIRWNPLIDLSRSDNWSLPELDRHLAILKFRRLEHAEWPIPKDAYFMDDHIENLLLFHPETTWWAKDKWYEAGAVVLQDKASCMPAVVLMRHWERKDGDCIDATYAADCIWATD